MKYIFIILMASALLMCFCVSASRIYKKKYEKKDEKKENFIEEETDDKEENEITGNYEEEPPAYVEVVV